MHKKAPGTAGTPTGNRAANDRAAALAAAGLAARASRPRADFSSPADPAAALDIDFRRIFGGAR